MYILVRSLQLLDFLDNFQNNYLLFMVQFGLDFIWFILNLWLNNWILIWSEQNYFWNLRVLNYHGFHYYT